jgi:hypothetical protein
VTEYIHLRVRCATFALFNDAIVLLGHKSNILL